MSTKKARKRLVGTEENGFGSFLTESSWVVRLKSVLRDPRAPFWTSYAAHSESMFNPFSLFNHHFGGKFPLLRSPQNSYDEDPCSTLVKHASEHNLTIIVPHLVFLIAEISAFKVARTKISNSHTDKQCTLSCLSPVDQTRQQLSQASCLHANALIVAARFASLVPTSVSRIQICRHTPVIVRNALLWFHCLPPLQ